VAHVPLSKLHEPVRRRGLDLVAVIPVGNHHGGHLACPRLHSAPLRAECVRPRQLRLSLGLPCIFSVVHLRCGTHPELPLLQAGVTDRFGSVHQ
jgi:hypothetical protein